MRRILTVVALAFAGVLFAGMGTAAAATHTVRVTESDIGDHWFRADTRPPGTGVFVDGPATPPLGRGSFELNTPTALPPTYTNPGAAKVQLLTDLFNRLPLRYIDGVGYSTYRHPSAGFIEGVNAINIRVDLDGNGTSDAYMVYEPYQNPLDGPVLTGQWQDWDAYKGGAGRWWLSTGDPACSQASPCPWATIVASHPNATIREAAQCGPGSAPKSPCPGSFGVNQGSNNPEIKSSADALYLSAFGHKVVFDFERGRGGRDRGHGHHGHGGHQGHHYDD